jgi:subtilisin family serine protease
LEHKSPIIIVSALALILVMVLPLAAPAVPARAAKLPANTVKAEDKIAPELLKSGPYGSIFGYEKIDEALRNSLSLLPLRVYRSPGDLAKVAIYFRGGKNNLLAIEKEVYRVVSAITTGRLSVAYALATREQVLKVAQLPFVVRVEPQHSLLEQLESSPEARMIRASGMEPLSAPASGGGADPYMIYSAPNLTGARYVWEKYGINGSGVKIGIVDTGVDLGSPDLGSDKVARASDGTPLVFDADEIGLTLLVQVNKTGPNTINVTGPSQYHGYIPVFVPIGAVGLTNATYAYAYNSITHTYSLYEEPILNKNYTIPDGIEGNVTFGLAFQIYYLYYLDKGIPFYGVLEFTAPVILADTDGNGVFDTAYVDLSTTYYLVMKALSNETHGAIPVPDSSLLDLSFADEPALNYTGNLVAARDFTGDGVPDFSVGALAGALYDFWGAFTPSNPYGLDWRSAWEPTTYVLPGYDAEHGMWLDLLYDFHGHGTNCAHVAAATGETNRTIVSTAPGVNFTTTMPGQAPGAKVGGAVALWAGDVVTAELWLAGFDQVDATTYTWNYTGTHQVDVISNSWGSSWLLFNGYASDADPLSLWEDLISVVSGTVIVHAAGNGGPGFGSVTIPGAAAFVITVGAAVDFYYRPTYGIGNSTYLPGTYGLVVSWSDRGPTEFGYPKPDVLAIGSFEWAGNRALDAPYNGTYAYELFGGTSEATPMTAGAVALIIQALREANITPTPLLVKAVLKSTATGMGFDAFSQGSGFINVSRAVDLIEKGGYIVYSYDSAYNLLSLVDETMAAMLGKTTEDIWNTFEENIADTAVYPGPMLPGETKNVTLYIQGIGVSNVSANVSDYTLRLNGEVSLVDLFNVSAARLVYAASDGSVVSENASSLFIVGSDGVLYLDVSAVAPGSRIAIPLNNEAAQELLNANFTVISLGFPASYYFSTQPDGRPNPVDNKIDAIWEFVVWFDLNNDSIIDAYNSGNGYYYETGRLNYDYRVGPVYHLEAGDLQAAILRAAEAVSNYTGINVSTLLSEAHLAVELRVFSNAWYESNIAPMPLNGAAYLYTATDCGMVSEPSSVSSDTSVAEFNVTVSVPATAKPGVYEGYVVVETPNGTTLVPVSVPVAKVVNPYTRHIYAISGEPQGYVYDNYAFRSALDQTWRPEVGDWRVYPIAIPASASIISSGLHVVVNWQNPAADYDAGLIGPGFNWWGVLSTEYAEYIDAAVLGGKLTLPYQAGGVYTYFDYPMPGMASFIAPLDPLRAFRTGERYIYYWLVVHQKFSDRDGESPFIVLDFSKFMFPNEIPLHAGAKGVKDIPYLTAYHGPAMLLGYDVLRLIGSGSISLQVNVKSVGRLRIYQFIYDASNAQPGDLYLAIMYLYEPAAYSVIVGYTDPAHGFPYGDHMMPVVPMVYWTITLFYIPSPMPL